MLQVAAIREQTDKVLEGLRKRNFKEGRKSDHTAAGKR